MQRTQYRIIVSPKGRKASEHLITAPSPEDAQRQATTLAARRGTTLCTVVRRQS